MIDSIRILGKPFSVEVEHPTALNGDLYTGRCISKEQRILLDGSAAREWMLDTLLHEVVHAVSDATQADLEEAQVGALASGLTAVLLDNPDFVRLFLPKEGAASPAGAEPKGRAEVPPKEPSRDHLLAMLLEDLEDALGSSEAVHTWFETPNDALGGKRPIRYITSAQDLRELRETFGSGRSTIQDGATLQPDL